MNHHPAGLSRGQPRPTKGRTGRTRQHARHGPHRLASQTNRCHTSRLSGCSRGDHTDHRRIRYRPGTVEGARQVNQP
jgi:hypothetical protein